MYGSTKVFLVAILFVTLVSLACSATVIPTPTNTSRPSNTPRPTLIPGVLVCSDIEKEHEGMTDMQWEAYKQSIEGNGFYFSGKVNQVSDDGSVFLIESCGINLYKIPQNIAIKINKGDSVEGYGTIWHVSYMFVGVWLDINVKLDTFVVH